MTPEAAANGAAELLSAKATEATAAPLPVAAAVAPSAATAGRQPLPSAAATATFSVPQQPLPAASAAPLVAEATALTALSPYATNRRPGFC